LKRCQVFDRRKVGGWSDEEVCNLAEKELVEKGSILAIVNTRKSARSLYRLVAEKDIAPVYHLSTNMCPKHRLDVLSTIKEMLKEKKPVICISTQLIEAGVDIDFGSVIRYLAGLDSITQAAGRCNREGIRQVGNVWIVNPKDEDVRKLIDIMEGQKVAERVLDEFAAQPMSFSNNLLGLEAMGEYYRYYFFVRKDEMDYSIGASSPAGREDNLFNLLSSNQFSCSSYQRINNTNPSQPFKQSFQTASNAFKAIDSYTRGVVAPYGKEGKKLIADLCSAHDLDKQFGLVKKAQRYSVNLLSHEFKQMIEMQAIHEVQDGTGIFYMQNQYYHPNFGWSTEVVNEMDLLII
jgi:CRISPR-associated endonuclease/helicase Cas3